MRPVFLIGPMCSGKSVIGRSLAQAMGKRHADIDRVIERRVGAITPWFQQHGEEAFRVKEREVLLDLLVEQDTVVSTGGGTPFHKDNMQRMLEAGTVVYLDVPIDELISRSARKGGDRPLLFGYTGDALAARVRDILHERLPVYQQAHMRVRAGEDPDVIVRRIQQALEHAPEGS